MSLHGHVKHCPRCNDTAVNGQGAARIDGNTVVQYRCRRCGELFFGDDKRGATPTNEEISRE
jgi:hypothetical protein